MSKIDNEFSDQWSDLLLDDSFVRFLRDEASQQEQYQWEAWMQKDAERVRFVNKARHLLDKGVEQLEIPDCERELVSLKKQIEGGRYYEAANTSLLTDKVRSWTPMAVAASVILLIGLLVWSQFIENDGTTYQQTASISYRTLSTEYGERTTVRFSDGSEIVINAHSQLRLPEQMLKTDTVKVWLKGEAYFNIRSSNDSFPRQFIVQTKDGNVSVLGTQFAVNTNDDHTEVVLSEGSVRVQLQDSLGNVKKKYDMKPNELTSFTAGYDSIAVRSVNPRVYTSWTGDWLILDDTPLSTLIRRIELTYGITFIVEDKAILKEKLSGELRNYDLDLLLDGLSNALSVKIRKEDQMVYIK